ncbi:MAG TPA: hypothetical protein PLH84_14400 [Candidatus Krumholzibacteria bacterium]|nr:hypothetical protein [Candidatus Krumholzibacteria bacterium]
MITPGTESRRTPKRQRRLASAATLVIGLLLVLSGCGDDQGDCVNCPQGAGDFRPGLYRLATSITVCGSGETFLEHEELIAHCNEGPIGGALPCDYTLDGTTLTMDCTIADYPFGNEGCTATATFDVTGTIDDQGSSSNGTISLSDFSGTCILEPLCLAFESSVTRLGDAPADCGSGLSDGLAQATLGNGPLAGTYTMDHVEHTTAGFDDDLTHYVQIGAQVGEGAGFTITIETPAGVVDPGVYGSSEGGGVTMEEGSGGLAIFYGDAGWTGTITITAISASGVSGSFSGTVTGEFVDESGTELQSRTVSGVFSAGEM